MQELFKFVFDTLRDEKTVTGLNTQLKTDGSEVTNADLSISDRFTEQFSTLTSHKLVVEEHEPVNTEGDQNLIALDPVDGTAARARGLDTWNIAATRYDAAMPVASVAGGWGIRARYRVIDEKGKAEFPDYFGGPFNHQGYLLVADANGNRIKPLFCDHFNGYEHPVPPQSPPPLTDRATLLMVPCLTLPSSYFNAGVRVVTAESSIGAQVEVILGTADGCILGPETSLHLNPGQPTPRLWDLLPKAVDNASLVYVAVTGPEAGVIIEPQDLIAFCDENYKLTEQLLVCHRSHIAGFTARIHKLRAMLKLG